MCKMAAIIEEDGFAFRCANKEIYEKVKEAIDKREPKKATYETKNRGIDVSGEYDIDYNLCCPDCGAVVGTFEGEVNEYFENFCGNCGQAIDVSYTGCEEGDENE